MHTSKVRVSWEHGATETGKMETSAFDTLFNFEGPKGGRKGRRRPFLSAEETSIGGEKHASEGQRDFPAEEQRPRKDGGVAQLGEHLPCKQGVKSSNLSISICRKQLNESESKTKLEFSARQFTNLNERK